jgi:hypothetical protein
VGETGNQAAGTIGSIKRRSDLSVGLCDDNDVGLRGDEGDASVRRALLLGDVHVEDKLEPVGSRRRRAPIIIVLLSIQ